MHAQNRGLHKDAYERDSCGFGLIASLDDQPSHWLVRTAITSLNRLTHRGAIAADGKTGDGCGLLLKKPETFLRALATEARHRARRSASPSGLVFLNHGCGAGAARARGARSAARARGAGAGRLARGADRSPTPAARRRSRRCRASSRCSSIAALPTSTRRASTASCSWRAGAPRRRSSATIRCSTCPSLSAEHHRLQGHGDAAAPGRVLSGPGRSRGSRLRWRCSTSASRPTRCRSGGWRTRSAFSRTTARSTPSRAIATGRVARGPMLRSPLLPDLSDILPLVSLHRLGLAEPRQHARGAADGRPRRAARACAC